MTTAPPPPPAAPPPAAPPPTPSGAWQPGPVAYQRTNGMAVAALVLGILFCFAVTAILAVVFGNVALGRIDASQGTEKGRGMAIAGIVLGWIGIVVMIGIPAFAWLGYGISNL